MTNIFQPVKESEITKAIVGEFSREFLENVESEVIIIGGGPSGLNAARELAKENVKVLIVESNNYLGGGFWVGGYLMNKLTIRGPGQKVLDEIDVPYKEVEDGLFVTDAPQACSKLISSTCDFGVKILNCTKFDDVVLKESRVSGVVINWNAVSSLPREITCVDPVALESKLVIDASGHDAVVAKSLEKRNLLKVKGFQGMDVNESEDLVVENTKEIFPGLIVTGMAVAEVFGLPRMGPTFGGMLLSGEKAAKVALDLLKVKLEVVE
jgi:thiamine thiazole synthase